MKQQPCLCECSEDELLLTAYNSAEEVVVVWNVDDECKLEV